MSIGRVRWVRCVGAIGASFWWSLGVELAIIISRYKRLLWSQHSCDVGGDIADDSSVQDNNLNWEKFMSDIR